MSAIDETGGLRALNPGSPEARDYWLYVPQDGQLPGRWSRRRRGYERVGDVRGLSAPRVSGRLGGRVTPPLPENVVADIEAAYNHADNLLHALRSALVEVEGYDPNPWWYVVTRLEDLVKWADETEDRLSVLFDEIDEGGES